jgi:phosphoribosylformimino-5-aminoimidazole carboxamide ribonucleotide (ProFAR) isomerase
MLAGPNLEALAEMREAIDLPLIASGGVTSADDVAALRRLGMTGCIIGRALYENTITMAEALAAAHGPPSG